MHPTNGLPEAPPLPIGTLRGILCFALGLCGSHAVSAGVSADATLQNLAALRLPGAALTTVEVVATGTFAPPGGEAVLRGLPPFCRVAATLKPTPSSNIKIEVWMPRDHWNGRFLGTGNGGGAGSIVYPFLAAGLKRGFATANTDMGTSPRAEAVTAYPERWADWGYRATHEMTLASKAIVQAYYGKPARHSYFHGSSTGGHQALTEAQRYPEDYDGIVAGCPANNRTHLHAMFLWDWQALRAEPGSALPPEKVALLNRAVIKACADKDGGAPGDDFLTDPRMSTFDPASLLPPPGQPAGDRYLTPAQVAALKKIYAGPTDPRTGERIFTPPPPGSEAFMGLTARNEGTPPLYPFIFMWGIGDRFAPGTFDFGRDLDATDQKLAAMVNANNPDLSGFRQRGGKMLMYSGTADASTPFQDTLNYYERVIRAQGGLARTQEFFRYFVVPGMKHGYGGPGLNDFGNRLDLTVVPRDSDHDILTALVRWVEQGVAPERIIATAYFGGDPKNGIRFQRPIYPYPMFPHYRGGDVSSPASYDGIDHERGGVPVPAEKYLN